MVGKLQTHSHPFNTTKELFGCFSANSASSLGPLRSSFSFFASTQKKAPQSRRPIPKFPDPCSLIPDHSLMSDQSTGDVSHTKLVPAGPKPPAYRKYCAGDSSPSAPK